MVYIHLATGFEEIEALTVADVMKRAGIEARLISVSAEKDVTGAHGIKVSGDMVIDDADYCDCEMIVLPGGMPGTINLLASDSLCTQIKKFTEEGKYVAAICAAPMILGRLGILSGHKATIYPGMEAELLNGIPAKGSVVVSRNIITSKGPGTAMEFALIIVEILKGKNVMKDVARSLIFGGKTNYEL